MNVERMWITLSVSPLHIAEGTSLRGKSDTEVRFDGLVRNFGKREFLQYHAKQYLGLGNGQIVSETLHWACMKHDVLMGKLI